MPRGPKCHASTLYGEQGRGGGRNREENSWRADRCPVSKHVVEAYHAKFMGGQSYSAYFCPATVAAEAELYHGGSMSKEGIGVIGGKGQGTGLVKYMHAHLALPRKPACASLLSYLLIP